MEPENPPIKVEIDFVEPNQLVIVFTGVTVEQAQSLADAMREWGQAIQR